MNSLEVFFTRAFAQSTKGHARLYPFDKPMKLLYFRSFVNVLSVLFALFHFKVIRKSLYHKVVQFPQDWFDTQMTAV